MNSPAAAETNIRLSPADTGALLMRAYDLRGRDGNRVCTVAREEAERGIAAGSLELWKGPAGAYLRSASLPYPERERATSRPPDSRPSLPRGAVRPVVHTSKNAACGQVGSYRARRVGPAHATPAA
jgi:hypothetical protein